MTGQVCMSPIGCVRNVICDANVNTFVIIFFNASEIVRPEDAFLNRAFVDSTNLRTGGLGGPLDIFSSFGMSCENKKWYVTKYPHGLRYYTQNVENPKLITGDLDGKKSEIKFISCVPPMYDY
ncbi:hypothetical protein CRE_21378 [Caenorhabditis remanei]|uniref:Uncharacterized protein n=1 Tax=Caenorhabditis remanei TaxID=31234 RepID=E3MUM7_CAERE|nr:hypothetical protein CRE_21378 [Caenorhabditis remanei]